MLIMIFVSVHVKLISDHADRLPLVTDYLQLRFCNRNLMDGAVDQKYGLCNILLRDFQPFGLEPSNCGGLYYLVIFPDRLDLLAYIAESCIGFFETPLVCLYVGIVQFSVVLSYLFTRCYTF